MAGDWIPMRLDLHEDPAVIQMASALKVREEVIVGYLHKIWSWSSRQVCDGFVTGVTLESLGRVTNLSGFPELMRDSGWLSETKTGIKFPNWDHWLSESAKKRLKAARRKGKSRHAKGVTNVTKSCDQSVTTVEKSTVEKSTNKRKKESKPKKDFDFEIPTLLAIKNYCESEGKSVDAVAFFAHYESNGWMVGKNRMKKWKSAIATWQRLAKPKFENDAVSKFLDGKQQ